MSYYDKSDHYHSCKYQSDGESISSNDYDGDIDDYDDSAKKTVTVMITM